MAVALVVCLASSAVSYGAPGAVPRRGDRGEWQFRDRQSAAPSTAGAKQLKWRRRTRPAELTLPATDEPAAAPADATAGELRLDGAVTPAAHVEPLDEAANASEEAPELIDEVADAAEDIELVGAPPQLRSALRRPETAKRVQPAGEPAAELPAPEDPVLAPLDLPDAADASDDDETPAAVGRPPANDEGPAPLDDPFAPAPAPPALLEDGVDRRMEECCPAPDDPRLWRPLGDIAVDITERPSAYALDQRGAETRERCWQDAQGQKFIARFLRSDGSTVYLLDTDGQQRTLALAELSLADRRYLVDLPPECTLGDRPFEDRWWAPLTYTWKASALCHKPLYFEEVALERYGHDAGPLLQPVISGAHFFGGVACLPYKMGLAEPCECVYALGYYRPGSCAPYMIPPCPLSARAALIQAGVIVGGIYALP